MKSLLLTLIIGFSIALMNHAPAQPRLGTPVKTILKKSMNKAQKENKKILVLCYSSTSTWSNVLEEYITIPEVNKVLSTHFVLSEINPKEPLKYREKENPGAKEFFDENYIAKESDANKANFPTLFILSAKTERLAQHSGFPDTEEAFQAFLKTLKSNANLNDDEVKILFNHWQQTLKKYLAKSADQIIKEAVDQANRVDKRAMIIFHASWCHWCHVLDSAINDVSIRDIFQRNYVIDHLTVLESENRKLDENPGSHELLKKHQGESSGLPFLIILNKSGNVESVYTGFPSPLEGSYYDDFEKIIRKTAKVDSQEFNKIKEVFTNKSKKQ